MKKIFITSLITVASIAWAAGGTSDRTENRKDASMAEQDFLECAEMTIDCPKGENSKCCLPEIIVVNADGFIMASGENKNEVIIQLVRVSDFLTEVHGTRYYRMNQMTDLFQNSIMAVK